MIKMREVEPFRNSYFSFQTRKYPSEKTQKRWVLKFHDYFYFFSPDGTVEVIEQGFANTFDTQGRYRLEFCAPHTVKDQVISLEGVTIMSSSRYEM